LRAEERKKALDSLIEAVTDRTDREGDFVISLGANVNLGFDGRFPNGATSEDEYVNALPLSLRTGLAFQLLPNRRSWLPLGGHVMVSALDLAQFATLNATDPEASVENADPNAEETAPVAPKAEITTAVRFGLELGVLFGKPSFPIAVTGQFAYVPKVTYGWLTRSEWSVGASVGVFVPFFDFN
jgi:hypothetical protein